MFSHCCIECLSPILRCEQLIADARTAVKDESTDKQRHIQLTSDLQQALSMVGAAAYQQANTAGQAAPGASGQQRSSSEDDVVDAGFTQRQ